MKIYKDEDTRIIFEYLKEHKAETNRRLEFECALERYLTKAYHKEKELKQLKEALEENER